MSENIFETASRKKTRFNTTKGFLSVEDLWQLSLDDLDTLAIMTNKMIKDSSTESFVKKSPTVPVDQVLKLDILKRIIDVKLEEKKTATDRAEKKVQLDRLKELALRKKDLELEGKSLDEINALIAKLEK